MATARRKAPAPTASRTAVGAVFAAPVRGGFAACQIVRQREGALLLTALDWFGKKVAQVTTVRGANSISIGPGKALDVPLGDSFDWASLEQLGCLSELDYTDTDRGVLDFLRRAPIIRNVAWQSHGQESIDVSALDLDASIIDHAGELEVIAAQLSTLTILGTGDGLAVHIPDAAALHLRLSGKTMPSLPVRGLEALAYRLELQHFAAVSFAAIARHAQLVDLEIVARPQTRFSDLASLADLSQLKKLEIREGYSLDADALVRAKLPPSLEHVVIRGYSKERAAALRAVFGAVSRFELSGGRDAEWLVATLLNPFDWSDADPSEVCRATQAWATAIAGLGKATSLRERTSALNKFVHAFNTIQKRGLVQIDAARSAELQKAFDRLVERARVSEREGQRMFDEWRKF